MLVFAQYMFIYIWLNDALSMHTYAIDKHFTLLSYIVIDIWFYPDQFSFHFNVAIIEL